MKNYYLKMQSGGEETPVADFAAESRFPALRVKKAGG